jgi:hypothetical protein
LAVHDLGNVLWLFGIGGAAIGALILVNTLRRRPPRSGPAVEDPNNTAHPDVATHLRHTDNMWGNGGSLTDRGAPSERPDQMNSS